LVAVSINPIESLILHRNIGRVRNNGMILLAQNTMEFFTVLDLVKVLRLIREHIFVSGKQFLPLFPFKLAKSSPMQQGISHSQVKLEGGGVAEFFDIAASLERGDEEAEARDADGEGIEIDAVNGIEGVLGEDAGIGPRFFLQPEGEETLEGS
jgi:hypothetical protein